jgi:phage terminase large subunit GpA-like protein
VRLWPYQREIADAISDPMLERVTLVKGVRLGFTTLLTGAIGGYVANEHAAILALLPTDSDARDYVVSELEPIFSATPALRVGERQRRGRARNTITSTRFADGSLRVIAARAPRNLRRVTARILLIDEADAMVVTAEGNPIRRRTMSYSTARSSSAAPRLPRTEATSSAPMARATRASSRCRAPSAARFHEITWGDIEWQADHPETAAYRCPACKALVLERCKTAMGRRRRVARDSARRARPCGI